MNYSIVTWRGLTKTGLDALAVASIGGNTKTGHILELSLIPFSIVRDWPALSKGVKPLLQGTVYVKAMRDRGLIKDVCPGDCIYVDTDKGCYVQHNVRSAGQVARIIRDILTIPAGLGIDVDAIKKVCRVAKALGVDKVRSMVVGDAGMLPPDEWTAIEAVLLRYYPPKQWRGYTHDWRNSLHLQLTHVASCDTPDGAELAMSQGWNVFEVLDPIAPKMPPQSTLCPASKEFEKLKGFSIGCGGCPIACNGSGRPMRRVIPRHANGDAARKAAAARRGVVLTDSKGRLRGLYAAA